MAKPMPDLVMGYRFNMKLDGKDLPCALLGDIEVEIVKGQPKYKPVVLMRGHHVDEPTLVERLGMKPWNRKTFMLQECVHPRNEKNEPGFVEMQVVRNIILYDCRVTAYRIGKHDAMDNDVAKEWVNLHPRRVKVITLKTDRAEPSPVQGVSVTE
jgi:hypothetical protein